MNKVEIGRKLRELRGDQNIETVASSLEISQSALRMYERGERIPRDQVKVKLSRFYGVPVEQIFSPIEHNMCSIKVKETFQ